MEHFLVDVNKNTEETLRKVCSEELLQDLPSIAHSAEKLLSHLVGYDAVSYIRENKFGMKDLSARIFRSSDKICNKRRRETGTIRMSTDPRSVFSIVFLHECYSYAQFSYVDVL